MPLELRLYVAAAAPNSREAEAKLRELLRAADVRDYHLEIVDCLREPLRALGDGVLVTPTLVKLSPEPRQSIVGTLAQPARLASVLGLEPAKRERKRGGKD